MKPKENGKTRGVAAIVSAAKLNEVAEEAEKDAMVTRKLLLGCIEALLVNYDFLSCGLLSQLEDEKGRIEDEVSEDVPDGETETEIIDTGGDGRFFKVQLQGLASHLSGYTVSRQKEIIERYVTEVLPGLEVEERNEEARDAARDELLDFVSEFSYERQADYYRRFLEGAKNIEVSLV